jgi:hypothetical protein
MAKYWSADPFLVMAKPLSALVMLERQATRLEKR